MSPPTPTQSEESKPLLPSTSPESDTPDYKSLSSTSTTSLTTTTALPITIPAPSRSPSPSSTRTSLPLPITTPLSYLTPLNALSLVISLQIGSGIFATPTQISQHVPTPLHALSVWLLAGLLVSTGASSFVELGLRVPSNGGIQEYLRAAFGDVMGFSFTWIWTMVAKPATNGLIATIFAGYFGRAFGLLEGGKGVGNDGWDKVWVGKGLGLGCVAVITGIHCLGATAGAKAANVFLVLKIGALGSIILIGLGTWMLGKGEGVPTTEGGWLEYSPVGDGGEGEEGIWFAVGNFATAVFGALFCYGGWETVGFVLGDMENPAKDLPLVINGAMTAVITGFILMNATLYICLPMEVMRASTTVAVEFARRTLGSWGGIFFSLIVSISAMGALNSNMFALGKLCVKASHRNYFPQVLANLHCETDKDETEYVKKKFWMVPSFLRQPLVAMPLAITRELRWEKEVPLLAILLNGMIASFYVVVGSFNGLITFIGLAEYSCYFSSVLSLLVLRYKESQGLVKAPPRKTWLGNPIIFAVVSSMLIMRVVITEPFQGLAIFVVELVGLIVFYSRFGFSGSG